MSLVLMVKAPDDVLDYDVDFAKWLPDGDRIISIEASIDGSTATITKTEFSDAAVKIWASGGLDGETAHISIDATTLQGRTKDTCFKLRIKDCR